MMLEDMPEALSWSAESPAFDEVHAAYLHRLERTFIATLRRNPQSTNVAHIVELRDQISRQGYERFVTAPETSRRLFWPDVDWEDDLAFYATALLAEAAREGIAKKIPRELWTAVGDVCYFPDGHRLEWPHVPKMMPLDFGSPHAVWIDLSGATWKTDRPREPLTLHELNAAFQKIESALDGIGKLAPRAVAFSARFNKVLVIQKDNNAPTQCQSGSTGQFVGRSFVTNVQNASITEEAVAEAVVHEAVHSILYMHQILEPWGPAEFIYDQKPRIASPWTGRPLPLRSFVEACFVWYALAHLWCYAVSDDYFEGQQVRYHLLRAIRGFLGKPLADPLAECQNVIHRLLVEVIDSMQARVRQAIT
jgi:hypothetical protein